MERETPAPEKRQDQHLPDIYEVGAHVCALASPSFLILLFLFFLVSSFLGWKASLHLHSPLRVLVKIKQAQGMLEDCFRWLLRPDFSADHNSV